MQGMPMAELESRLQEIEAKKKRRKNKLQDQQWRCGVCMHSKSSAQYVMGDPECLKGDVLTHLLKPGQWRICRTCSSMGLNLKDNPGVCSNENAKDVLSWCNLCKTMLPKSMFVQPESGMCLKHACSSVVTHKLRQEHEVIKCSICCTARGLGCYDRPSLLEPLAGDRIAEAICLECNPAKCSRKC